MDYLEGENKSLKELIHQQAELIARQRSTMEHLHATIPSWFWLNTRPWTQYASPHFTAANGAFKTLLSFCTDITGTNLDASEILVVSTSVGRILHSAQHWGHATAHIRRPSTLEGKVEFRVGKNTGSPQPSIVVDGLRDLCTKLGATL